MTRTHRFGRPIHWGARLLAVGLAVTVAGCESLLEVENPNNIPGEDIRNPTAATALVNGVHSTVSRGIANVTLPIATASDELDWVGSRDAWRQLDFGNLSDPFNEFTDAAFPFMGQGRWMADEAIEVLEEHRAAGRLVPTVVTPLLLVRAYVYGAMAYITIGDHFDRWAFSDLRTPAAPLAPGEMGQLYDDAIVYLNRADSIAQAIGSSAASWRRTAVALRARARHARAIWNMIGSVPDAPANITNTGLVDDAGAVADAQAALGIAVSGSAADWKFEFKYSATTVTGDFGPWVNDRQEMRLGNVYVYPSTSDKTWDSTRVVDPITGARDPVLNATTAAFKSAATYPTFTVVSAREMHLILAESELFQGDTIGPTSGFANAINAVRLMNFPDSVQYKYDPANAAQPRPRDMLIYSRQVNLYLQGRRLNDMYRFGIRHDVGVPFGKWQLNSEAVTEVGRVLPITARECLSNPLIGASNCRL